MRVTLVPASVCNDNGRNQFLTSFVIDETVALDAGSIGFYGTCDEQRRIQHVLLSHSHIDHLASLPIFLENVFEPSRCVAIHASENVIDCLQRDVFNQRLWPDFINLKVDGAAFLTLHPLVPGKALAIDGLRVTPVPVNHSVPTLGFIVEDEQSALVFTSDTGPTDEIWNRANDMPHLKAVFVEVTFPNDMADLANVSKHLTPALFAAEANKLRRPARLIVVHIKPRFYDQVTSELHSLKIANMEIGRLGATYEF